MAEGTVKTIDQLPTKQNILGTDFIPLDDGMQSYKTTWAALLALTGGIASASISGNMITITTQGGQTYTLTPSDSTKQDVLTFDLVPTNGSANPVTSDGIYDAVHDVSVALAGETSRATAAEAAIPAAIANRNYYGTCATSASTAEKEVTILDTTFSLVVGAEIYVKFTHTNTATNPTIKVNDTAAKPVLYSTAAITTSDLDKAGYADRYEKYVYDGTYWVWAGWSIDSNAAVTNVELGQGYATCDTAAATAAKLAVLSGYELVTGGVVAVKFDYAVPASATLSINGKTAKPIYYGGAAITAEIINAGDIATFIYNGSQYVLLGIDYDARGAVDDVIDTLSHYKDVTISATASTGTVGGMDYTHTQTVSWTGMTANDEVRLYITGGTYDDDIAVDSQSGQCVIYFGSEPTTLTTVRLVSNAVYAIS